MDLKRVLTQSADRKILLKKEKIESKTGLKSMIENLNLHVNSNSKEETFFKKKIDKLNLKFYIETEKYLKHKHTNSVEGEKCQETLFLILFQQISLYIEEVERLNSVNNNSVSNPINMKDKIDNLTLLEKENTEYKKQIQLLKKIIFNSEKKVSDLKEQNFKMKRNIDSLTRQNKFYLEKMRLKILQNEQANRQKSSFKNKFGSLNKSVMNKSNLNKSFNSNSNKSRGNYSFQFSYTPNKNNNINQKNKNSGYYSRTITRQVLFSKSVSKEKFTTNSRPNEEELNNFNSSILNDLDMMNSTYSKVYTQNSKGLNNNSLNNKSFNPYSYDKNGGDAPSNKVNNKIGFNNLKVKLSENNIKELLENYTNSLDEELNWIEYQIKKYEDVQQGKSLITNPKNLINLFPVNSHQSKSENYDTDTASIKSSKKSIIMQPYKPIQKNFNFKPKKK